MKVDLIKTLSFALLLATALSLLQGCAPQGGGQGKASAAEGILTADTSDAGPQAKESSQRTDFQNAPSVTFMKRDSSATYRSASGFDDRDNPYSRYIFEKTGVRVVIQYQPEDGYSEKMQLVLASGDPPDIMDLTGDDGNAMSTARSGALEPINDYLAGFKNLGKVYDDAYWKDLCFDSNRYFLKSQYVLPVANKCTLIRQDWLDKLHLKMPTTVGELYDAAKAFVAARPDGQKNTFGITARKVLDNFWALSAAYGNPQVASGKPYVYIDKSEKKLVLWNISDAARAYYMEVEKWWNEGLIDKECLTTTSDQFWDKINNGKVGIICHNAESTGWLTTWIRQTQKRTEPTLAVIPALQGSGFNNQYGVQGGYEQTEPFENYWGFPSGDKNIENVLKVFDYECSPEFIDYAIYGLKGLEYTEKDGKKVVDYNYRQTKSFSDDYLFTFDKADMTEDQREAMLGKFAIGDPTYDQPAECLNRLKNAFATTAGMSVPLQSWVPLVPKLPEEDLHPDVDTAIADLSIKLITGELNAGRDSDWNSYLKAVQDSGLLSIMSLKEEYLLKNFPQFFN